METVISLSYTCDIYILIAYLMAYFCDIKRLKVTWTVTRQAYKKLEKLKFLLNFLNKDISFDIS